MKLQENKRAIVTGVGRGIGRAIALAFAAQGADVALAARSVSELESTANEIKALGRRTLVVQTDVTNLDCITSMVQKTAEVFGGLDFLVNNAGVWWPVQSIDMTEDDWDRMDR